MPFVVQQTTLFDGEVAQLADTQCLASRSMSEEVKVNTALMTPHMFGCGDRSLNTLVTSTRRWPQHVQYK
jgi:hypothetical protein